MTQNHRQTLLEGLWGRMARAINRDREQREFLVGEITHIMSCHVPSENSGR